jgi:hypothetical protein
MMGVYWRATADAVVDPSAQYKHWLMGHPSHRSVLGCMILMQCDFRRVLSHI